METVILVDRKDNSTGTEEKMKAHEEGVLHRAFSVLVFNKDGELLIQRRALTKYHSPGMWSNTCCSHPRPGEKTIDAAHRRLKEEMGFDCELKEAFSFVYRAGFGNGLTEHEYDHVFIGRYDGEIRPSPEEVSEYRWISIEQLKEEIRKNPEGYTPWLKIILDKHDFTASG